MFCKQCKNPIKGNEQYCPNCGTQHPSKINNKKNRKWIFFIIGLFITSIIFYELKNSIVEDLNETVEGQLVALRKNKITEAYYQYTSHDFQSHIPLTLFKELIKGYDSFLHNEGIEITDHVISDGLAVLKGRLSSDKNKTPTSIEYELIKEGGKWKILSILLATNSSPKTTSSEASIEWLLPIDAQLRSFRKKDIKTAYEETNSKEFKSITSLSNFSTFIEKHPIFFTHKKVTIKNQSLKNNEAQITIVLNPEGEAIPIRYQLIEEDGEWKIWNMNVLSSLSPAIEVLLKNPDSMKAPIEELLQLLKVEDLSKAYSLEYTSQEFQDAASLEDFKQFIDSYSIFKDYKKIEIQDPVIDSNTGLLEVSLTNREGKKTHLLFTMGIENDKWKIWGLQILSNKELALYQKAKEE